MRRILLFVSLLLALLALFEATDGCKVVRVEHEKQILWGVLLSRSKSAEVKIALLKRQHDTLSTFLQEGGREEAFELCKHDNKPSYPKDTILLPYKEELLHSPVTSDRKIVCQAINFDSHAEEVGMKFERRNVNEIGKPLKQAHLSNLFIKASSALTGPFSPIVRPPHVQLLDYEAEIGLVVSKKITPATFNGSITYGNLHQFIAGVVIANDVSARDVQLQVQWMKGKSYRTFAPVGPYLYLMKDNEFTHLQHAMIKLWVNDDLRQNSDTTEMIHSIPDTLSEIIGIMDLFPGDLILTGTPAGVAIKGLPTVAMRILNFLFEPKLLFRAFVYFQYHWNRKYLNNNDVVRVRISSADYSLDFGEIRNQVIQGDPYEYHIDVKDATKQVQHFYVRFSEIFFSIAVFIVLLLFVSSSFWLGQQVSQEKLIYAYRLGQYTERVSKSHNNPNNESGTKSSSTATNGTLPSSSSSSTTTSSVPAIIVPEHARRNSNASNTTEARNAAKNALKSSSEGTENCDEKTNLAKSADSPGPTENVKVATPTSQKKKSRSKKVN